MGYIALKIIKTTKIIQGDSNYASYTESTEDTEDYNPSSGYINLKPFDFSMSNGIETVLNKNLSRNSPRLSTGSSNTIPLTFSLTYSKLDKSDYSPVDLVNSMIYLDKASKKSYIGLLYWIPSNDNDIFSGQCNDYYSSLIRVLNTNQWDGLKITESESGYTSYEPLVIPIKLTGITFKEMAGKKMYTASCTSQLITKEEV